LAGSINDGLGLGDVCTQILEWAPQRAYAPHAWERLPLHLAQNDANSDAYGFNPFSGVLTITAGTGKLRHAQGSLTFAAQAGPTAPYATNPGMFNNNFVLNAYYAVQGTIEM
jgi:hypothetical protein